MACDIVDPTQVDRLIAWAGPLTHVFHLAAVTFVPQAMRDPARAFEINVVGTVRLITAVRHAWPNARIVHVSSAEVYGRPHRLPMREGHALNPVNPYAVSKMAADLYTSYLCRAEDADIVCMRPFNHSGPGQSPRFVLSDFARQVAEIEAGHIPPTLRVGNLNAARDFSHVRDVVRAYTLAALQGGGGEVYNVCSGQARTVQSALDGLLSLSSASVTVEVDEARLRPVDVPEIYGSYERLNADTGWEPAIPFESLLKDLLEYWRVEVATKGGSGGI